MKSLGHLGRAGNQFFQYIFLRTYAARNNLKLQVPKWVGCDLFGFESEPVTVDLPRYSEDKLHGHYNKQGVPPKDGALCGKDFHGFAQYHTSYYAPHRDEIIKAFTPLPHVLARVQPAVDKLRESGRTVVGVHFRRGDYIVPLDWYARWLDANKDRFLSPLLFVATEDHSLARKLSEYYEVRTAAGLGVEFDGPMAGYNYLKYEVKVNDVSVMDWFPDFWLLTQCDVIAAPSSTFSFFAAMLAPHLLEYWRASLKAGEFVREDPWNAYPLLREKVADYPHLEGIKVEKNPYWS